jgi:cytochrome c-type biogenesis protein CcmH
MMRYRLRSILSVLVMTWVMVLTMSSAGAVQPDEILSDPALETRARALSKELRCMVCQNQSIDDSDAPLARDLRILVRERLKQGDSDRQVLDYLTARYGDFVLLRPPFSWHTALLWLLPGLVLLFGVAGIAVALRQRRRATAEVATPQLTAAERARLAALMEQEKD